MKIVVKVGTSTLAHSTGRLNVLRTKKLCETLVDLKNAGYEIRHISTGKIIRSITLKNINAITKNLKGIKEAKNILKEFDIINYNKDDLNTENGEY